MQRDLAIKKIDEIYAILSSANRLLFSGSQLIAIGILLFVIPPLHFLTDGFTFGLQYLQENPKVGASLRGLFFGLLFYVVGTYGPWRKTKLPEIHPLLVKTFRFERTFVLLLVLTAATLLGTGQKEIMTPIVLVLIGLMFNVMSAHTISTIRFASWGLMLGGLAIVWLNHLRPMKENWMVGVAWLGLMILWMGVSSIRTSSVKSEHGV